MAQSLRQDFREEVAKTIFEDIQFRRGNYYYFLGKVEPWGTPDIVPAAPDLDQTKAVSQSLRSGIVYAKKISPSEVTLACDRHDWISGTVYAEFDNTQNMINQPFYVMTDEYKVYKCLDNANGAPSTTKPTGNSIYPIKLDDGYLWKYMYTIAEYKRKKFLSVNYIPCQRALSDSFYNNGKISDAVVLNAGSGYSDQQLTNIVISGTTTGEGAVATVALGSIGEIVSVNIVNGGTGYTKGVTVKVIGNGSSAVLEPVIVDGVITDLTIVTPGVGYDEFTTVDFSVGGAELVPIVSRDTGQILEVRIINPGSGYTTNPTLTVTEVGTPTGSGLYGNATAIIEAIEWEGSIARVNIIDPGQDYKADTSTTISVQGDGTGAAFTPVVFNGSISDVIIENGGVGYTNIVLTVNSATGTGAVVEAIISPSDLDSDQSYIEQTAVSGSIYNIKVTYGGSNYSSQTYVSVVGNGTGCTATPIIEAGILRDIQINTYGNGYTYANVLVIDPLRDEEVAPVESKAIAYAILPPNEGHGADALFELYADTLVLSSTLRSELQQYGILQDYRSYGIIKNPRNLISGARYLKNEALVMYQMKFNTVDNLNVDDILVFSSNKYRVVHINDLVVFLTPVDKLEVIPIGALEKLDGSYSYQAVETVSTVDFDKYSGKMLYVSLEQPFVFNQDQSLLVKTYIEF